MSMGRYWIFFVIVAVGLVLSWGQVGRKTEHELRERPVDFLSVESGCDPMHAPCAAYAGERAMVLGPEQGGLLLKLAGIDPAEAFLHLRRHQAVGEDHQLKTAFEGFVDHPVELRMQGGLSPQQAHLIDPRARQVLQCRIEDRFAHERPFFRIRLAGILRKAVGTGLIAQGGDRQIRHRAPRFQSVLVDANP